LRQRASTHFPLIPKVCSLETLPQRVNLAEALIEELIRSFPEELQKVTRQVHLNLMGRPEPADPEDALDTDLLGLFEGEVLADQGESPHPFPPQITLFLDNLLDAANGCPEKFQKEIKITYLHELGHFLGWDEEDLERRQLD